MWYDCSFFQGDCTTIKDTVRWFVLLRRLLVTSSSSVVVVVVVCEFWTAKNGSNRSRIMVVVDQTTNSIMKNRDMVSDVQRIKQKKRFNDYHGHSDVSIKIEPSNSPHRSLKTVTRSSRLGESPVFAKLYLASQHDEQQEFYIHVKGLQRPVRAEVPKISFETSLCRPQGPLRVSTDLEYFIPSHDKIRTVSTRCSPIIMCMFERL